MKIEHIAIWVCDLEKMRQFYQKYFGAACDQKYENPKKRFKSYFLTFESGVRLELMQRHDITQKIIGQVECLGLAHFAVSMESEQAVDNLTAQFKADGFTIMDGPRRTGDGYYESVILDPEGNRLELTAEG